jgi:hypothetical protein
MASQNRKASKVEMAQVRQAIQQAFPEYVAVFGGHSSYGGHRAPRDHTISFRLRDRWGKWQSNVIWLMPEWLSALTPANIVLLLLTRTGNGKVAEAR